MSRAKRLGVVLELAERDEQKAAQAAELAKRVWQEDQNKLDELCQYYNDYQASFSGPSSCRRAEDIARQRMFLTQLADAKKQQTSVVEKRHSLCTAKQQAWQQARLKRKAMQELIERLRADEAQLASRRESKMLDEWFNQSKSRRDEHKGDS